MKHVNNSAKWGLLLCILALIPVFFVARVDAADDGNRKVKVRVQPQYPTIAKQFNAGGVVKLEIEVAPSGDVRSVKALGGHPLLIPAAEDAVRKWRYEPAKDSTTTIVEFRFVPSE